MDRKFEDSYTTTITIIYDEYLIFFSYFLLCFIIYFIFSSKKKSKIQINKKIGLVEFAL